MTIVIVIVRMNIEPRRDDDCPAMAATTTVMTGMDPDADTYADMDLL
jgi:hypothetical protein